LKKVLTIVHDFPPVGGGAVMRTLKFVKYLPYLGWKPIVVTVNQKGKFTRDVDLLDELPPKARVYRTRTFEPHSMEKKIKEMDDSRQWGSLGNFLLSCNSLIKKFLLRYVLIPDKSIGWLIFAFRKCDEVVKRYNPSLIFSTSPPHSTHLVGYLIAKRKNLPFVADFRDEWIGNPLFSPKLRLRYEFESYLERQIVSEAKYVISATQGITEHFKKKYKNFDPEKL